MKNLITAVMILGTSLSVHSQSTFEYLGNVVITFTETVEKSYPNKSDSSNWEWISNHQQVVVPQNECWMIVESFINKIDGKDVVLNVNTSDTYENGKYVKSIEGRTNYYLYNNKGRAVGIVPILMTKTFSIETLGGAGYLYVRKFQYSFD